jgi:hypothetical protein
MVVAVLSITTVVDTLAEHDVYALLEGKNVYVRVKKDSVGLNNDVFKKYEKQTSKKIIAACVNSGVTYSVVAQWDLEIASRAEAEMATQELCTGNGAFGGILLGYKVKREIRF